MVKDLQFNCKKDGKLSLKCIKPSVHSVCGHIIYFNELIGLTCIRVLTLLSPKQGNGFNRQKIFYTYIQKSTTNNKINKIPKRN